MKTINRKKELLLAVLLLSMYSLSAQIIIDKNDMPSQGDIVRTSTGLNLGFIDYQETGEDYNWDFSELTPISQSVDTFVSQLDVPLFYIPFFMFSSNLAVNNSSDLPIPDFPITNQYTFFNNTNSSYGIVGDAAMLYGFPIPLKFNSADILYQFPMNYGNTGNSYADYSMGLEDFGYISKEVTRSNTVDGWGTLTTPYGTFEVLRLKSEVIEFDSIYLDSLGIGLPIYREYTEYSWLAKNQKIPLLQITSSFGGVLVTYVDSVRSTPSAINNNSLIVSDNLNVFPNPAHDIVNISFDLFSNSDIEIDIYNLSGIKVANNKMGMHMPDRINIEMNLRNYGLNNGIYFLKIVSGNQHVMKKVVLY